MAVNINIKGSTHKSFKIGKNGVTMHQGNNAPLDVIDGDVWFDKVNYTPRMYNESASDFQLPLMDAIGFKNNMLVSLASDINSDDANALEIDGFGQVNVKISESINDIPLKTSEYDISSNNYGDDFVNNIVIKGKGEYGGLVVANDGNIAMVKTIDNESLKIRAGNSSDQLLPGDLYLSGGESFLNNTFGNVYINGISYPLNDGKPDQILTTNGNGSLFFQDPKIIKDAVTLDFIPQESPPMHQTGRLFFDKGIETLSFYINGTNAKINLGQELHVKIVNNTSSEIKRGMALSMDGVVDGIVSVVLAKAMDKTLSNVLGIASSDIQSGEEGLAIISGCIQNIDTALYNMGDTLWLSSEIEGVYTQYKPDDYATKIGVVLSNNTNGNIKLDIESEIIDSIYKFDDIEILEPTNGQVLTYEDGKWKNTNVADSASVGYELSIDAKQFSFVKLDYSGDLSIYNVPDGAFRLTLLLTKNASNLNFSGLNVKWHQGTKPAFSPSDNDDIVELITFDGGVTWYGSAKIDYL